jgi:hypothetical protein
MPWHARRHVDAVENNVWSRLGHGLGASRGMNRIWARGRGVAAVVSIDEKEWSDLASRHALTH